MKIKNFLMCVCGALAFAACSTEEPVDNGKTDVNLSDGYVSVSIAMPAATRADDDFENGTEEESKIKNVLFFFFDNNDVCVDIQKIDDVSFDKVDNKDPHVESIGCVELRLKTGLEYSKVAVVLNSTVSALSELQNNILDLDDLTNRTQNYLENVEAIGQPMSNSVYYDNSEDETKEPKPEKKIILVPITEKNIYTSAEKSKFDQLIENGTKEYVEVYVERVLARIDVEVPEFSMEQYYISKNDDDPVDGKKTLTVYNEDLTTSEITIKPVLKGMILNVLADQARLIKPMSIPSEFGYGVKGSHAGHKNFRWNDFNNKRCYWAMTDWIEQSHLTYKSWNDAEEAGINKISEYVHPNTQKSCSELNDNGQYKNELLTENLKVMVVAELHKCNEAGEVTDETIDLVRYGADYMLPSSLFAIIANNVNNTVRSIDWTADGLLVVDGVTLNADQIEAVRKAVYNAFVGKTDDGGYFGVKAGALSLAIGNTKKEPQGKDDGMATIVAGTGFNTYTIDFTDDELNGLDIEKLRNIVNTRVNDTITDALNTANAQNIYYWKDGKTYFYTAVRHQGFYGLTGLTDTGFLFGVVRNHIYKIKIDGLYGLGTPVIDPAKPINPDRPDDELPSYIQARINVLKWRVVPVNVTIH